MTKNERIAQLEDKIEVLEEWLIALEARLLFQRQFTLPVAPVPNRYPPLGPFTLRDCRCTCGTSAVCPLHGSTWVMNGAATDNSEWRHLMWAGRTMDANMGYKS